MADWPSISNPDIFEEESYKPSIRTEFEGNYVQERALSTRVRRRWKLGWTKLTDANYSTLKTFFGTNKGTFFNWTHYLSSTVYVSIFSDNGLKATWASPGFWRVEANIEEL